jgi:hypothetical protein
MQTDMAIKIQQRWRAKHARRHLLAALASVYQKIRDPTTGAYFYFNTRTGESSWTKPRLLGSSDLPETFYARADLLEAEAAEPAAPPAGGTGSDVQ